MTDLDDFEEYGAGDDGAGEDDVDGDDADETDGVAADETGDAAADDAVADETGEAGESGEVVADDAVADETSGVAESGEVVADDADADADDAHAGAFDRVDATPTGHDRGLGTVSVAEGLRVAERAEDSSVRAFVTVDNRADARIGKYVLVPYPDGETLFSRIAALEYAQEFESDDATEIHARRQMRRDGVEERDYKFLADLEPKAVVYPEGGELKRRMVDRVPKPGSVVTEATDEAEIKTGLKIPEEGVFLGHLSVGGETVRTGAEPPTVDYRLTDDDGDGDPLVFRHTLVAGGTGSGKTHAAKNVLRQYLAEDRTYETEDGRDVSPAVVQFDPQDEYAQMHDDNPAIDADVARRLEREGVAHGGVDDTLAMVPVEAGVRYGGDGHHAEQLRFTIPFSMARSRPWLVAGSSLNDNQYPALATLLERFFRDYGDDGTYSEFLTYLDDPALKEELHESGRVHEATYDAVKRRVRGIPDGVFDQDAKSLPELDHELVRPGGLTVIPTYHLSTSRAKELFVLAVSAYLVDSKLSNAPESQRVKETPLLLGMDEAHNFLADADNVQARKVESTFTEAAKQGRKERLGLFLVTQDPQDIADPVFKQLNTKLVLNLGDEDAIDSVNIPTELAERVPYMEQGQMAVYSPDNSEPVELTGLSVCVTRHGD